MSNKEFQEFWTRGNPHRGQGRVLSILKMKPEMSQKELTYLLDMSRQALAELLNKLEKKGYIKRETSEQDHRSLNIKLTEKGAAASADNTDDAPSELEKIFDCLNDEELTNLNEYLKRIIKQLEEQSGDENEDLRKQVFEHFMKHSRCHHFRGHGDGSFEGRFHHEWDSWHDNYVEKKE